jgi:BASS family bile acid:Na+ symporter
MEPEVIDSVRLNFSPGTLLVLNAVIGLMMFGMALDMKLDDFARVVRSPRSVSMGLAAQFLLLPAFSFLLTLVFPATPSMALGMILIAACPGGNVSNIMTYLAKGNVALSVSMTAVSTAAAIVMTPLNLAIWGRLNPVTAPILRAVSLSPLDVLGTIVLILGLPLAAGLTLARLFPAVSARVRKPFKIFSIVVFIGVVALALQANWDYFLRFVGVVFFAVVAQNALALSVGYGTARLSRLPPRTRGP